MVLNSVFSFSLRFVFDFPHPTSRYYTSVVSSEPHCGYELAATSCGSPMAETKATYFKQGVEFCNFRKTEDKSVKFYFEEVNPWWYLPGSLSGSRSGFSDS